MKIAPHSAILLNPISNTRQNKNFNLCSVSSNDTFVKSCPVFKGNPPLIQYQALKGQMTDYILNSDEFDLNEIQDIIREYSPETSFDDFRNIPRGSNINEATAGYTTDLAEIRYIDGKLFSKSLPKTVYMHFPYDKSREGRIILLDRILHECTHVLQDDATDRTNVNDLINEYLQKEPDQKRAVNTLKFSRQVYNIVERDMNRFFAQAMPKAGHLPKEVSRSADLDKLCMRRAKMSLKTMLKNYIKLNHSAAQKSVGEIDWEYTLNLIAKKAEIEKEAYQNALDSDKELLGIKSRTDFDLRVEMYDTLMQAALDLKD